MDDKGRVALPVRLRTALERQKVSSLVVFSDDGGLSCLTPDGFRDFEEHKLASFTREDERQDFTLAVLSCAEDVDIDGAWRIRLPPLLRNLVGIEAKDKLHVFTAAGRLQIWSSERWQEVFEESRREIMRRNSRAGRAP